MSDVALREARADDRERLAAIDRAATDAGRGIACGAPLDIGDPAAFEAVRATHAVAVAVALRPDGREARLGFGAAIDLGELHWLARLAVDPNAPQAGKAAERLLEAAIGQARWLFHRAIGLTTCVDEATGAGFFSHHGFMAVPDRDLPPLLAERKAIESVDNLAARQIMVRWL